MTQKILIAGLLLVLCGIVLGAGCRKVEPAAPAQPSTPQPTDTAKTERNFVALGDSFTKANNLSNQMIGDSEEYSFATGAQIESVWQYLTKQGEKLKPVNLGESGATSNDVLTKQALQAATLEPLYVTLLTGGPDLLTNVPPAQFQQNLEAIIAQIQGEDMVILIGTIPNLAQMRTASYPACSQDKLGLGIANISTEKIQTYNAVIKSVAQKSNLILVDLFPLLGPQEVSDYDCLHPNIEGQKKFAQAFIESLP